MAVPQLVWNVVAEQLEKVMELDVPEINQLAKKIAYYDAMIDAAEDSPLDEAEDQAELMQFFKETRQVLIEGYQSLVNEHL